MTSIAGAHTCQFCLMLASRGFVYHSAKTAGEFAHYHSDCRCKVVAGFPEMIFYYKNGVKVSRGVDPTVEGYDPDSLYNEYKASMDSNIHRSLGADVTNDRPSSNVILDDEQFGKKAGKHCRDWGLDPSKKEDRARLVAIIEDIIDHNDQHFDGEWRGQPSPCTFYIKGEDAVVVNGFGRFVTIMRGAARSVEDGGNRRLNSQRP